MSAFALPGENKTNEILLFCPMRYDYLINVSHKIHFVHIPDFIADTAVVHFPTTYSKIA